MSNFDHQVRDLIAFAYANSPALKQRMKAAGLTPADIQSTADLSKLPILSKQDLTRIQQSQPSTLGGMLTVPIGSLKRIFQSPGPIFDPEPNEADSWRWASSFRMAGIQTGDVALNCFGYHLSPAGAMFEEGARAAGIAVVPGGIGAQQQQIDCIETLGVTIYAGLPSYLKGLIDKAKELGRDPKQWKLRIAVCAAEPLPPSLRKWFADEYGSECYNVYGTAECGNLGFEGPDHNGFILPDDALIQVCDLNTGAPLPPGQTGEVVVTLFRRDYILVRFGVGDLSALMPNAPQPRLVGWLGRSSDSVKVRGLFVHPRHVDETMRKIAGVARYQAVVTRDNHRDDLTVKIVATPNIDTVSFPAIVSHALHEAIKLKVNIELITELPADAKLFVDVRTWE